MNLEIIEKYIKDEPKFRIKQIYSNLFNDLFDNWSQFLYLPKNLKTILSQNCSLEINSKIFEATDKKSAKALLTLDDGLKVETVLMKSADNRRTVCVSSQVGCPMGCKFCATGKMGFTRNLTASEIIEQVLLFSRYLKTKKERVTNVVFMGMGEPFLNYNNVMDAIKILNDKDKFNIGARHISISTSGIINGIEKLSNENLQINLAISLHAPDDKLRSSLMPVNEKYPLKQLFEAIENYIKKTSRKVMFEYLLIQGVNDSEECALKLTKLMKNPLYMVNLIPYNPTGSFKASSQENIKKFKNILTKEKINFTERYRFGRGLKAACGQLATKN